MTDAHVSTVGSNFVLPPALAGRVWEHLRAIQVAPPSEKLDAFRRAAQLVAGLIGADFPKREAVERVWTAAQVNRLLDVYGEDVLQSYLAEGFSDPIFCDDVAHFDLASDCNNADARPRSPAIRATPYIWREPSEIPSRQWLYGRLFIRRYLTETIAPGGLGKSSLAIAESLALVTGRNLLGVTPRERVNVWYWNGEDPYEEIERRIAAVCQHFGIERTDVEGRLFVDSGHDLPIKIAEMNGARIAVAEDVVNEIVAVLQANRVGLLQIDPFISCHGVPENDNGAIDAVAKAWGRIADRANTGVGITHHVRKLAQGQSGLTVEDSRGAGALMNAARVGRTLNSMSEESAKQAGVDERRFFFRSDNGKANLGPPETTTWFQLVPVALANGDSVGVVAAWTFPGPLDGVTVEHMHKVRELARQGAFRKDIRADDWIGRAVANVLALDVESDRDRLKGILKIWFANGVLAIVEREDEHRKKKAFVIPGDWNEGHAPV